MNLAGLLKKTHSAGSDIKAGLSDVRGRIADLQAERRRVESLPPELDTAVERIDRWVAAMEHTARAGIVPEPARFAASPEHYRQPRSGRDEFAAIMVAFLGDELAARVKAQVQEVYADRPGISDAEREKRLAQLDRDLLDAELAEESLIRAAEAAGFTIARRADSDPRAVLADQKEMP